MQFLVLQWDPSPLAGMHKGFGFFGLALAAQTQLPVLPDKMLMGQTTGNANHTEKELCMRGW